MTPAGLLRVTAIQVGVFLAPFGFAWVGILSGEAAGVAAIGGWFVLGMPLSYTVHDRAVRRAGNRREAAPRPQRAPAAQPSVLLSKP